jgi:starvation-inducible DNA-binding protein
MNRAAPPRPRSSRESRRASDTRFDTPRTFATKNDLADTVRIEVINLLNQRLAEAIDLELQSKQAHWNVKGPSFIALHHLFDDVHGAVDEYVDLLAERIVQLGGVAEGTVGAVQQRTSLIDYPLAISNGAEHVAALSDALAQFGRSARIAIDEMNDLKDAASADILTEITRGVDKWLWFVEAHQQQNASPGDRK